jgi:hypothetical protein
VQEVVRMGNHQGKSADNFTTHIVQPEHCWIN